MTSSKLAFTTMTTTSTNTFQLRGPQLILGRVMWLILFALSAGLAMRGIAGRAADLPQLMTEAYANALTQVNIPVTLLVNFAILRLVVVVLVYFGVATLIFWRRSDRGLALIVSLVLVVSITNLLGLARYSRVDGYLYEEPPLGLLAALIQYIAVVAEAGIFYFLPDGQFMPRWSKWVLVLWAMLAAIFVVGFPGQTTYDLVNATIIPFLLIGIYCQVYRYRYASDDIQRQQTKWVIVGLAVAVFGFLIYTVLLGTLLGDMISRSETFALFYSIIGRTLWELTLLPIPLAFAVAVLRYRLWDVDLVMHRSAVYIGLTTVLAGVFGIVILVTQNGLKMLTGGEQPPTMAIVASTLAIVAVFQPVHNRLKAMVDRRFPKPGRYTSSTQPGTPTGQFNGKRFGAYEVLEPLGRGGMAEVYRGRHVSLHRDVAIKVLIGGTADESGFQVRFEREAQTVAALRHPNIVQVFDYGMEDGQRYMVMEYIDGLDLTHYLRERERLPLAEALPLIRDIAAALDYAHQQGVIHRDVKSSNIILQKISTKIDQDHPGYRAVLADFGVAKITSSQTDLTKTGVVGTLDYLAPEQITTPREIDYRADLYAFGVLVFLMLTGRLPFEAEGGNYGSVLFAHIQKPAPNPREFAPDLSSETADAILRLLAKAPQDRYESAEAFVAALV